MNVPAGSIHSLYREGIPLTGLCWDALAAVAGIAPPGTIGILGLVRTLTLGLTSQMFQQKDEYRGSLNAGLERSLRRVKGADSDLCTMFHQG